MNVIISYPKSGRTWLRVMLGKMLCDQLGAPDRYSLEIGKLTELSGLTRTSFSHDGSEMLKGLRYKELDPDKRPFRNARVLFLSRDVRDVMVSCYFQATRRIGRFDGSIGDFLRDERFGVRKALTFFNIWYDSRAVPREFAHLAYESMHRDPSAALDYAARWIGLRPNRNAIEDAVEFSSFDSLRKKEAAAYFPTSILTPARDDDPENFKVRRGKVGGYAEYLREEDIAYIDAVEQEMGNPFSDS